MKVKATENKTFDLQSEKKTQTKNLNKTHLVRIISERPSIIQLLILIKLIVFERRTLDSLYFLQHFLKFLKNMFQVQLQCFWVQFGVFNICALNTL